MGNPDVMRWMNRFVESTVTHYTRSLGNCVVSFSPTNNNEFETRFTETYDCMRDYNEHTIDAFYNWQKNSLKMEKVISVPKIPEGALCFAPKSQEFKLWIEFRNVLLHKTYSSWCNQIVKISNKRCMLHFGEIFNTAEQRNGNALFMLMKEPNVTDVILDSNMALFGAAASPSITGMMVDTVREVSRAKIHYEAATERIYECTTDGKISITDATTVKYAKMLLKKGISNAVQSGVHSIGVTNLCKPDESSSFLMKVNNKKVHNEKPTAILYTPYRAWAYFNKVVSKFSCGLKPINVGTLNLKRFHALV